MILADPIFQGLAISLMAGSLVSMIIAPVAGAVALFHGLQTKARSPKFQTLNKMNWTALLIFAAVVAVVFMMKTRRTNFRLDGAGRI